MTNRKYSGGVVEDIWMNTRADDDDLDEIAPTDLDAPADWSEGEEADLLINSDVAGMYDRG